MPSTMISENGQWGSARPTTNETEPPSKDLAATAAQMLPNAIIQTVPSTLPA